MKCLGGLFCSRFPFFSSGPPALSAIAAARAGTSEGSAAPAPLPSRPEARLPPLSPRPSSPASPSPPAAAPGLVHLPAKGGGDRGPASRSAGGLGKGGRCGARPGRRRRPDSSALAFSFAPSPVSASLGWAGQGRAGPGRGWDVPAPPVRRWQPLLAAARASFALLRSCACRGKSSTLPAAAPRAGGPGSAAARSARRGFRLLGSSAGRGHRPPPPPLPVPVPSRSEKCPVASGPAGPGRRRRGAAAGGSAVEGPRLPWWSGGGGDASAWRWSPAH